MKENITSFTESVLSVVRSIPKGNVLTYKHVAEKAGSPRAFRAVGSILKKNYRDDVPCHRVIKSNGDLGQYNRGASLKKKRLQEEGAL